MSIELNGIEGVLDRLDSLADLGKYEEALRRACALVERSAKQNAPKGNGDLRRSITSKVETSNGELRGIVYTPLEYAPYVEYGTGIHAEDSGRTDVPWVYCDDEGNFHTTSGMPPHPYMRPALDDNREEILRQLREALTND